MSEILDLKPSLFLFYPETRWTHDEFTSNSWSLKYGSKLKWPKLYSDMNLAVITHKYSNPEYPTLESNKEHRLLNSME